MLRQLARAGKREAAIEYCGGFAALVRVLEQKGMPTLVNGTVRKVRSFLAAPLLHSPRRLLQRQPSNHCTCVACLTCICHASLSQGSATVRTDKSLVDEFVTGAFGNRLRIGEEVFYVPEAKPLSGRVHVQLQSRVVACTADLGLDIDPGDEIIIDTDASGAGLAAGSGTDGDDDQGSSSEVYKVASHDWRWVPLDMGVQTKRGEYIVRTSDDPRALLDTGDIVKISAKRKWGREATPDEDAGFGVHVVVVTQEWDPTTLVLLVRSLACGQACTSTWRSAGALSHRVSRDLMPTGAARGLGPLHGQRHALQVDALFDTRW